MIVVVVATAHGCVDYEQLADWAACVVDTRNAMAGVKTAEGKVWKAWDENLDTEDWIATNLSNGIPLESSLGSVTILWE